MSWYATRKALLLRCAARSRAHAVGAPMKRWLALVLVVAAAGLAAWSLGGRPAGSSGSSDAERRTHAGGPGTSPSAQPDRRGDHVDHPDRDADDSPSASAAGHEDSPPRHGVVLAASAALASEDPDHARWDALSPDERVATLEHALARAMADARAGGSGAGAARSRAETTLSTLRAELWPTPSGRARYLRFEAAVDELDEPEGPEDTKRGPR